MPELSFAHKRTFASVTSVSMCFVFLMFCSLRTDAAIRDGRVDPNFDLTPIVFGEPSAAVDRLVPLANGQILVGGAFVTISGSDSSGIARLNADGTFDDSFLGQANAGVTGIFPLSSGQILITGAFTSYGGVARNRVARLNSNGDLDQTFNPSIGTDFIRIVAVQPDEKIIIVGNFLSIGGVPRSRIARLHPDGTLDLSFNGGAGPNNNTVYKGLIQNDQKIVLFGEFSSYDGVNRNSIARINADGSLDSTFVPEPPTGTNWAYFDGSFTLDEKIYLAAYIPGSYKVIRINQNGTLDASFSQSPPTTSGRILAVLALPDGKVVAGGEFGGFFVNGTIHNQSNLVKLNSNGSIDTSFTAQTVPQSAVRSLSLLPDDKVLVGGNYRQLNSIRRGGIGRLNPDSTSDLSFLGFVGRPVTFYSTHVYPDGSFLLGGDFDAVDRTFIANLIRVRPDGSIDETFRPDSSLDTRVWAIAVQQDQKILLGGYANSFKGPRKGLLRINSDGTLDSNFDTVITPDTNVFSIVPLSDGKILISGDFRTINGVTRRGIARLNSNGSLDTSFNPNLDSLVVWTLRVQADGKILLGGEIFQVNGTTVGDLARLNSDGTLDTSFQIGSGANNTVYSIAILPNGAIYVGGSFSSFNGSSRRNIVRLTTSGAIDQSFRPVRLGGFSQRVWAILPLANGQLVLGGSMSSQINAGPRAGIMRLFDDGRIDYSFNVESVIRPFSSTGEVLGLALQPDNGIVAVGQFETINGLSRWGAARLLTFPYPTRPIFDFDGDGITDQSVFRPSNGSWQIRRSRVQFPFSVTLGTPTDKLVPGDYDGDFLTDAAVYRPADGVWSIYNIALETITTHALGVPNDIPAPGDFDGDGKTDTAVFRPSTGNWWINRSRDGLTAIQYGTYGDLPVVGDYDGDGRSDVAVYRPLTGEWLILRSTAGEVRFQLGNVSDHAVPADYDGDRKTDIGIFRSNTGIWEIILSTTGKTFALPFGSQGELPVPGNYDSDDKCDLAVFRASDNSWRVLRSTDGTVVNSFWGQNGDIPVHNAFVRVANFVSITGRVFSPSGTGLRNTEVTLVDSQNVVRTARTSTFGAYTIENAVPGNYTLLASSRRYQFLPRPIQVNGNMSHINFTGME
ncbi:MAG: carboxypeptidase regulatory-like domain-containing protein [Pyrinomonadaceae bacterium]